MLMFLSVATVIISIFIIRILYLKLYKNKAQTKKRKKPAKTLVILGSGGHTTEMLRILERMNFGNYTPRVYVHAKMDNISREKIKNLEKNNMDYKVFQIPRSREVRQSYLTSIWTTIKATLVSIPIVWFEKPELILCNGPGTCIPICAIAFIFQVFLFNNVKIIFIESFCRVRTLSLSGKILYYLGDYVVVQWPYLRTLYKRSYFV